MKLKINNYENNEIYFGMRTAIVSSALPGTKNLFNKYNDMKGVSLCLYL